MIVRKGILIGLALNMALGSLALYCIKITLQRGFRHGRFSTLGMTAVDVLYASILLWSISYLHEYILPYKQYLLTVAGILLIIRGVYQLIHHARSYHLPSTAVQKHTRRGDFLQLFMMTLFHPAAILMYLGVFSVLTLPSYHSWYQYVGVLFGIAFGSQVRWTVVIGGVSYIRKKSSDQLVYRLTQGTAIVIALIGVYLLVDAWIVQAL